MEVDDPPGEGGQHRVGQQVAEGAGDADVGPGGGQPPGQLGVSAAGGDDPGADERSVAYLAWSADGRTVRPRAAAVAAC